MARHGVLITLSPKRLAQLEEDPDTLEDVLDARHDTEIPGLLDVGTAWDALDVLLSDRGKEAVLGDAIMARTGRALGDARVIGPQRVAEIAKRLDALGASHVRDRYAALGRATPDDEEREGLEIVLRRVIALYRDAAKQKHSVLAIVI
jgi:uncharacterized protein DUF1877